MQRFGEILALLEPINYDWGYFDTKQTPQWLRHVATCGWAREARTNRSKA